MTQLSKMSAVTMLLMICAAFSACGSNDGLQAEEPPAEKAAADTDKITVSLSKQNLQHVQIKTEAAAVGNLGMTLKVAGRVTVNSNKTAKITAALDGRLAKLGVDIDDRVKTGDVLALVQSPELLGKALELRSPIDGVILDRQGSLGEQIEKGQTIYTVIDQASLWVIAEVKERDIAAVTVGQDAVFSVLSYPDRKFHGKVVRIGNQVEAESRTVEVRITADNLENLLKPGMFADVAITTSMLENVLLISDASLQTEEQGQIVFVAVGEDKFEKRPVVLGLENQGRVQVQAGLEPGDKVVTEGSFILKSEMLKGELGEE